MQKAPSLCLDVDLKRTQDSRWLPHFNCISLWLQNIQWKQIKTDLENHSTEHNIHHYKKRLKDWTQKSYQISFCILQTDTGLSNFRNEAGTVLSSLLPL